MLTGSGSRHPDSRCDMFVFRVTATRAFLVAVTLFVAPVARADDEKDIRAVLDSQAAAWNMAIWTVSWRATGTTRS